MGEFTDVTIINNHLDKAMVKIKSSNGYQLVEITTILYLKASADCTKVYFENNNQFNSPRSLKYYEELLNNNNYFVRINRFFIVNLLNVKSYRKNDGHLLTMNDGNHIGIGDEYKTNVLEKLGLLSKSFDKTKITVFNDEGLEFYDVKDIIYLKADLKKSIIQFKNRKQVSSNFNLKYYDETLNNAFFRRASRQYIFNIYELRQIKLNNEKHIILMSDNCEIELEGKHKDIILAIFDPDFHEKLKIK